MNLKNITCALYEFGDLDGFTKGELYQKTKTDKIYNEILDKIIRRDLDIWLYDEYGNPVCLKEDYRREFVGVDLDKNKNRRDK